MHPVNTIIKTTRPSFLILAPVCVFLGYSISSANQHEVNPWLFNLILLAAVLAHISVNMLNEYFDFKSGLDNLTTKTAFSGGSGALVENPALQKMVLYIGLSCLLIVMVLGVYFIAETGLSILPVGIIGIIIVSTYTQWINRYPLICLIAPGLGFGILIVAGTYIVLSSEYLSFPWFISLIPFFLINNLLLLNQYPDIDADKSIGRKTLPIVYGITRSNFVYAAFSLAAYLLILVNIATENLPRLSITACIPAIFSTTALFGAIKYKNNIGAHSQYLAANVAPAILVPLILGISILND